MTTTTTLTLTSGGAAREGGNLIATSSSGTGWAGSADARAFHDGGLYYFEFTFNVRANAGTGAGVGLVPAAYSATAVGMAVGYSGGGYRVDGSSSTTFSTALANNDVVCVALDLTERLIWFRKNGGYWNNASGNDPVTSIGGGTLGAFDYIAPCVTLGATSEKITANFGGSSYAYTPPTGFGNWPSPGDATNLLTTQGALEVYAGDTPNLNVTQQALEVWGPNALPNSVVAGSLPIGSSWSGAAHPTAGFAGAIPIGSSWLGVGTADGCSAGSLPVPSSWAGVGASHAATAGSLPVASSWPGVGVADAITEGSLPLVSSWVGGCAPKVPATGAADWASSWDGVGAYTTRESSIGSLDIATDFSGVGASRVASVGSLPIGSSWTAGGARTHHSPGSLPIHSSWDGVGTTVRIVSAAGEIDLKCYFGTSSLLLDGFKVRESQSNFHPGCGSTLGQEVAVTGVDTVRWQWRRVFAEKLKLATTLAQRSKYRVVDTEVVRLAEALRRASLVVLRQTLTTHQAQALAVGLHLLQALKIAPIGGMTSKYHLGLVQALRMNAAFMRFLGASLRQTIGVHAAAPTVHTIRDVKLGQGLWLHNAFWNTLAVSLTGAIDIGETDLLQAIYRGDALLDGVNLGAIYVDGSGTATTFAVNTRTNAITSYDNYNFNSFAQMGLKYVAASSAGIFELDGDTDAGAAIPAELETGYYQMAGTKMAGIKGCYLAMRGEGPALIKVIAGDGRTYVYQATVQPGLMNTKINIGKGLFARYFAFNLQTPGQDWDLDDVEFVPMMRDRRV